MGSNSTMGNSSGRGNTMTNTGNSRTGNMGTNNRATTNRTP
jgi:hypothetical protein